MRVCFAASSRASPLPPAVLTAPLSYSLLPFNPFCFPLSLKRRRCRRRLLLRVLCHFPLCTFVRSSVVVRLLSAFALWCILVWRLNFFCSCCCCCFFVVVTAAVCAIFVLQTSGLCPAIPLSPLHTHSPTVCVCIGI